MPAVVTVDQARARLREIIEGLSQDQEVVITENEQPVAMLVPPRRKRRLGTLKGTVLYMAPDFDAPLDDFREYME